MAARNHLSTTPPAGVTAGLERLGRDLRTARLRRNLTIAEVAERIGTGVRAVADAEGGKPTTAAAVYVALLWAYDLVGDLDVVAAPDRDVRGLALAAARSPRRASGARELDDDF